MIGLKTCAIVSFEQVSRPSIIIGPAARAFFRPEEDLRRAWGNVCGKGMALIMSLDPLDLPVLFVCLFVFFFHHSLILTLRLSVGYTGKIEFVVHQSFCSSK